MPRFTSDYQPRSRRGCPDKEPREQTPESRAASLHNLQLARRGAVLSFLKKHHLCDEDWIEAIERELGLTPAD